MTNKIEDSRAIKLLISNTFFRWGRYITTIFVNIYILSITNDLKVMALFNAIYLCAHLFTFYIFGPIVKSGYRKSIFSLGISIQILSYLLLMLFWILMVEYYILFAIFSWIWGWCYWIVFNNNEFDLTRAKNRWNFQGLKKALKNIITIIIPWIIGYIIGNNYYWLWYETAFAIWVIVNIFCLYFGLFNHDYRSADRFNFIQSVKLFLSNKDMIIFYINYIIVWIALSAMLISTIIPIIIYSQWINVAEVGYLVSFFWFFTIVWSYLIGKFVCYSHYKKLYNSLLFIYFVLIGIFLLVENTLFLVIFASMVSLIATLISIPNYVYRSNLFLEIPDHENRKSEYMVFSETFFVFGWILSYIIIYFIWDFSPEKVKIFFMMIWGLIMVSLILFNMIKLDIKK